MATFRALGALGEAVVTVLDGAWERSGFTADVPEFVLVRAEDLATRPVAFGVTVYVYRVAVNGTQRTLPPSVEGRRRPLPVEVDFVVSAWGPSAQRELELLGWCMRALDDDPVLAADVLNRAGDEIFDAGETVEVAAVPLVLDEMYRLWDALPWDYQLSAAYTARVVRLESPRAVDTAGPVLERDLVLSRLGR